MFPVQSVDNFYLAIYGIVGVFLGFVAGRLPPPDWEYRMWIRAVRNYDRFQRRYKKPAKAKRRFFVTLQ